MVKLALAFAYDRAGPLERAVALADEAAAFDELGDTWGAASSAVAGAVGALRRGPCDNFGARRRSRSPPCRLRGRSCAGGAARGLVGERRGDGRRPPRTAEALELSNAPASDRFVRALGPRFGRLRERELRRGRSAVSPRGGGRRRGVGVMAGRTREGELAQVGAAVGDTASAATLYRSVVAWSREPRRHDAREALFIALVGSPATAALVGLAELADALGDGAAADGARRGKPLPPERESAPRHRFQCGSAHLLAHGEDPARRRPLSCMPAPSSIRAAALLRCLLVLRARGERMAAAAVTPDRLQGASTTTAREVRMAAGDATTMVTSVRA